MPTPVWTPATTDVAAVIHNRTTVLGSEVGDFTTQTNPTAVEVQAFIAHATDEVGLRLPDSLDARWQPFAKRLAALRAAMMVEVSYDDDRTTNDTSTYARLKEMYDSGWAALNDALVDAGTGGDVLRYAAVPLTTPTSTASQAYYDFYDLLP
jgi:hypothetical protein